jgi:hypothetical protein
MFFDKQQTMVFLNKCLRCGKEGELSIEEGVLHGQEDYSPVDPDNWDA